MMRVVLFGGPLDHRELEAEGGTEKISFANPASPTNFITYAFAQVETDVRGEYLSFCYDPKAPPPQMV